MGATIYNSELIKGLIEAAKIQTSRDKTPIELAEKIIAVVETNPFLLKTSKVLASAEKTTTGNLTVMTTSATKDTYVTGFQYSMIKNATCDAATDTVTLSVTDESNASVSLMRVALLTLTAQSEVYNVLFDRPMKLARNTTITEGFPAFTAGAASRGVVLYGFEIDDPKA